MTRGTRKNKKRLERRRKTRRRQIGGGTIDSIYSWVQAVNNTPAFKASEEKFKIRPEEKNDALRLGSYKIHELKDDALELPAQTRDEYGLYEEEPAFQFSKDGSYTNDFRAEASSLRYVFSEIIDQEDQLTPAEFMSYMKTLKSDPNTDSSILQNIQFAEYIESNLQKLGRDRDVNPQTVLIDEQQYPLYILTLFANTPPGDDRPLLLSKEEVDKLSEAPIPDQQVAQAI